ARLVLDAPYGVIGQELEVQVRVENLVECAGFSIVLEYDQNVLKPLDFTEEKIGGLMDSKESGKGVYALIWIGLGDTKNDIVTIKGDVAIGTFKFKVPSMPKNGMIAIDIREEGTMFADNSQETEEIDYLFDPVFIPMYKNHPFTDITADWYKEAVLFAYNNNLMNGMGENKFKPDDATTRAMLTTILYRYEGEPDVSAKAPFTDLEQDWYKKPINWAHKNEIVKGMTDTTFAPDEKVTREQIATMLYRYAEYKEMNISQRKALSSFPDGQKVNSWAKEAMEWAYAEGLITGNSINGKVLLDPQGDATRAQIATILMRYIKSAAEQ
ncbi:MAG: S-layer homology domain-containing protein, partial [Clostridia bacterium]|nr:S-layer homology domain-containing protein [Clostridia bacterium]